MRGSCFSPEAPHSPRCCIPQSEMYGVLNIREIPAGSLDPDGNPVSSAVGDGCTDDTDAIEGAIRMLKRAGKDPVSCATIGVPSPPNSQWPAYYSGLYLPAGVYRITRPIMINDVHQNLRIFGDGGRGGGLLRDLGTQFGVDGETAIPTGTVIRQDTDDAPILVFTAGDTYNVTVERIGFSWRRRQSVPPGFVYRDFKAEAEGLVPPTPPTVPGAVGILFSSGARDKPNEMFYHVRVTDCTFEYGYRGVSIDETLYTVSQGVQVGRQIALFNTQVDHCVFAQMVGAAISWVSWIPIGMTSNSVRDVFIQNYNDVQGGILDFYSRNREEQIRLGAQGCCTLENVDAEGSKMRVLSAVDCVLQVINLYLEHVDVKGLGPILIYFGVGAYTVQGMNLDGLMFADNYPGTTNPSFSTIFNVEDAELVLSGFRTGTFPAASVTDRDIDISGGFLPLNGPTRLVSGSGGRYRLLDRPRIPVLPGADRGQVVYDRPGISPNDNTFAYREFATYSSSEGETTVVDTPPAKRSAEVSQVKVFGTETKIIRFGSTPAPGAPAAAATYPPVEYARIGDVVSLGLAPDVPPELVISAVVVGADTVDVRLTNLTDSSILFPPGRVTVSAAGGPNAGRPQLTS